MPLDVGIVFPGIVVPVLAHRLVRRGLLQLGAVVTVQPRFIAVDEYRRRDVHWVHQSFTIATTSYRPRWLICLEERGSPGMAEIWLSAVMGSAERRQPGFPEM